MFKSRTACRAGSRRGVESTMMPAITGARPLAASSRRHQVRYSSWSSVWPRGRAPAAMRDGRADQPVDLRGNLFEIDLVLAERRCHRGITRLDVSSWRSSLLHWLGVIVRLFRRVDRPVSYMRAPQQRQE